MKEIRHLKTIKNKRNLNTKWLLLQNDQNADTTLLHSHDDISVHLKQVTSLIQTSKTQSFSRFRMQKFRIKGKKSEIFKSRVAILLNSKIEKKKKIILSGPYSQCYTSQIHM